ncbi:hypothetical protein D3C76_1284460 [compost metagenome]
MSFQHLAFCKVLAGVRLNPDSLLYQRGLERCDKGLILFPRTYGNPYTCRIQPVSGSDDHAFAQQALENLRGRNAHIHHDEITLRGEMNQSQTLKLGLKL